MKRLGGNAGAHAHTQWRSLAFMSVLALLFAALLPLTAQGAEGGGAEECFDEVVEQLWERQAYQEQERERYQQWRWLREHKDVRGWEYASGSWVNRQNTTWYEVPAHLMEAANFDPRGISPTGSVPLSVYGGPPVWVQYQFVIDGPSGFTTDETSPYGPGSIKVDQGLSDWSDWQDVGDPFYTESVPGDSATDTKEVRFVESGELEELWLPVGETPEGEGWEPADGSTRVIEVQVECETPPSGWACVAGEVTFIEDATGFEGTPYATEAEAAADPDCDEPEVCEFDPQLPAGHADCEEPEVEDEVLSDAVEADDDPDNDADNDADNEVTDEVVADELPFTGLDNGMAAAAAVVLVGTGILTLATTRRWEES